MRKYIVIFAVVIAALAISAGISCDSDTTGAAPPKATNPNPANGATDVAVNTDVTWNGGSLLLSGEAETYTYDVYFGTSASPPGVASGITATTYDPGTLNTASTYYWRVDTNNGSQTTMGDLWSFTTETGYTEIIVGTQDDHINIPFCGG